MLSIKKIKECPLHIEEICRWHHDEWGYLNPGRPFSDRIDEMQEHLEDKLIPNTFICLDGDRPVGSASILECDMQIRSHLRPWLAGVYVLNDYRHRKIGRDLVRKIMEHVRTGKVKTLYLYTPDREHFYKHMNWQTIEKIDYHDTLVTLMKYDF
jgi:N-acetylglutamate synthase-like GNAT family acetyltransferase